MQKKLTKLVDKLFNKETKREDTTRKYTRVMIKKYGKTLKRLSYE
ncbi:MAG: hypothetical protein WBO77_05000 [Microgenomates group bacterium]